MLSRARIFASSAATCLCATRRTSALARRRFCQSPSSWWISSIENPRSRALRINRSVCTSGSRVHTVAGRCPWRRLEESEGLVMPDHLCRDARSCRGVADVVEPRALCFCQLHGYSLNLPTMVKSRPILCAPRPGELALQDSQQDPFVEIRSIGDFPIVLSSGGAGSPDIFRCPKPWFARKGEKSLFAGSFRG